MRHDHVHQRIESLRADRVRPDRDVSVMGVFRDQGVQLIRLEKRLGGVARAWQAVCPAELLGRTSVRALSRGVLTIGVEDASTRFELDRLLRSGAERTLIRACPTTVRKVKLVAAAEAESADSHD